MSNRQHIKHTLKRPLNNSHQTAGGLFTKKKIYNVDDLIDYLLNYKIPETNIATQVIEKPIIQKQNQTRFVGGKKKVKSPEKEETKEEKVKAILKNFSQYKKKYYKKHIEGIKNDTPKYILLPSASYIYSIRNLDFSTKIVKMLNYMNLTAIMNNLITNALTIGNQVQSDKNDSTQIKFIIDNKEYVNNGITELKDNNEYRKYYNEIFKMKYNIFVKEQEIFTTEKIADINAKLDKHLADKIKKSGTSLIFDLINLSTYKSIKEENKSYSSIDVDLKKLYTYLIDLQLIKFNSRFKSNPIKYFYKNLDNLTFE